jgi:hypothetical protein
VLRLVLFRSFESLAIHRFETANDVSAEPRWHPLQEIDERGISLLGPRICRGKHNLDDGALRTKGRTEQRTGDGESDGESDGGAGYHCESHGNQISGHHHKALVKCSKERCHNMQQIASCRW